MKQTLFILLLILFPFINNFAKCSSDSSMPAVTTTDMKSSDSLEAGLDTWPDADTIRIEKRAGEVMGYKQGQLLTYADYKTLFADNRVALKQIKSSNALHKTGKLFGFVGGFMFGYIGVLGLKDLDSVDYTWGIALGASAAIAGAGFLFYSSGNRQQIKAINTYNNGQINQADVDKISLRVGFTNSGVGLVCNF